MDWTSIEKALASSIKQLKSHDRELLEVGANERSLTHRLAVYLEQAILQPKCRWNIDCEYNRDGYDKKILGLAVRDDAKTVCEGCSGWEQL